MCFDRDFVRGVRDRRRDRDRFICECREIGGRRDRDRHRHNHWCGCGRCDRDRDRDRDRDVDFICRCREID